MKNLLYNMTAEQSAIYEMLDETSGELTPEIESELDKFEANLLGRAFTMKSIITRFEDKAKLAREKKDMFHAIEKECVRAVETGKLYIKSFMQQSGKSKLEYEAETISLRKTPDAVFVENECAVPETYRRFTAKLTPEHYQLLVVACEISGIKLPEIKSEVDKMAIKETYKTTGIEVDGTKITSDFSVIFKG